MSRVDNVAKNMKFAALSQIVLTVVNFVVRRAFVEILGEEYLGLNGLFTDILSMLSLAELGFGTSIVFSLYEPVACEDVEKIKSLMALYRRAYQAVGAIVLAAGLSLTPFLDSFVKEMPRNIDHIEWIYILNVVNSGVSYFFIYKASLLFAYQKKYVEMLINTIVKLCACLIQLVLLLITKNYFLYLGTTVCATLAQNLLISWQTDQRYPYLRERDVRPLEQADISTIKRNVGAMVFHKFGDVAIYSTDSILMAKFVSVASVGLYSNYMLIYRGLITVIDMLFSSITASMGNLSASEGVEQRRAAFRRVNFFSAWLFGWMSICLFWLYNPFIALWLGNDYLFPTGIVLLIVINFYLYCMRIPVGTTKNAMGLFWNDRYKPVAEAILNLVISIVLARRFGIVGVLMGTVISTLAVPFWIEPLVLYRHGLKQRSWEYFRRYAMYLVITLFAGGITGWLCSLTEDAALGFAGKMILCGTVPNGIYFLFYHRTEEFVYLLKVVLRLGKRLLPGEKRGRKNIKM